MEFNIEPTSFQFIGAIKTFPMAMNLLGPENWGRRASVYERLVDGWCHTPPGEAMTEAFAVHSCSGRNPPQGQFEDTSAVTADVFEAEPLAAEGIPAGLGPVSAQTKAAVVGILDATVADAVADGAALLFAKERPSTPIDEKGLA